MTTNTPGTLGAGQAGIAIEGGPSLRSRISWGAILAGAIIALAVGLMLNVLGAAVGAMMVDTAARDTPTASSFGIGAGVWLLISNLLALALGGYVAARLSGTSDGMDGTLHGVAVWAATFLVSAVLLGNVVSGVASTAATGATNVLGGIASGAGSVMSTAGQQVASRTSADSLQSATQSLIDRAQNALTGGGNPASMNSDQRKAEMASLIRRRVADGPLAAPERDRLNDLVAAEFGISPQEAQQRVDRVEQQTKQTLDQAEQRARMAADATAKGAAYASFAIFFTMLLGMGAAILGSRSGTRHSLPYMTRSVRR